MKSMFRILLLVLTTILLSGELFSQPSGSGKLTTKSKKARSAFENAALAWEKYQFDLAIIHLETALQADPMFVEAYTLLGDVYAEKKDPEKAIESYKKAVALNPDFFPVNYYNLANFSLRLGLYADAMKYYEKYLSYPAISPRHAAVCKVNMDRADYGLWAVSNPVTYNPENLGEAINTPYDEYINSISGDESRLYLTRRQPRNEQTHGRHAEEEDFYVSYRQGDVWAEAQRLPPPLNTAGNEGALAISPDGSYAVFTACDREDGMGSCDLYYTERRGNSWTEPVNLGENVNSRFWDTHASIASDGRTVYFVSRRPGGIGGTDIYVTVRREDGSFSPATNIGRPINTSEDEFTPFIHPDNQTLYFSSMGHMGMGGFDYFRTVRDAQGSWSEPQNLGYPINTHKDEVGLIINSQGDLAYISTNMPGGAGRYDIYSFNLPSQYRSYARVSYMKGMVFDKETLTRLQARFELIDIESGETVIQSFSDAYTGDFLVSLPEGKNYALNVHCDGYLFFSDHFQFAGLHTSIEPLVKDIPLQKISVGETVVLRNIFFDTDKYDLKPESVAELTRLIGLLKRNPSMRIEIGGYTDNAGSDEHNQKLSDKRAEAVVQFLTGRGIPAFRLSHKGYGKNNPIDTNDTPEGRANNRRTEFKVLSM